MATHNTTMRNSAADAIVAKLNRLEITDGATVLVTFNLTWSAASGGVAAVASTPVNDTADATGTADGARLYHSSGSDEITGLTIGTSGTQVVLDSLSMTSAQPVNLISCAYTFAAATA